MKKIFAILVFTLLFSVNTLAQVEEPTPIVADENTATGEVVVYNEFSLGKLVIEVSGNGFLDSKITVVANLGKRKVEADPLTGFKLVTVVEQRELFSGKLSAYLQLLERAKTANLIDQEQMDAIIAGMLEIYMKSANGFTSTLNILQGLGDIELKAKKVLQ